MKPPTRRYAEGTTVSAEKTQGEIRKLLTRAGADAIGVSEDTNRGQAELLFRLKGRAVRFRFTLPTPGEHRYDRRGVHRTERALREACAAELRRRWRVLLLRVKVRLELIAFGEGTVETEFLAELVLPDGRTVAEATRPSLPQLGPGVGR